MALPGFNVTVSVATAATGATYAVIDGIKSFTLSDGRDLLDTTNFADGSFKTRIAGLRDLSASLEGELEAADTGYLRLRAAYNAGNPIGLMITRDGTNGIVSEMIVESIERSASVDGLVEVSISVSHSGGVDPFDVGTGM